MDDQPQHTCSFGRPVDPEDEAYYQSTNSWPSGGGGTSKEHCPACQAEAAARANKPSDIGSRWPYLIAALVIIALLVVIITSAIN